MQLKQQTSMGSNSNASSFLATGGSTSTVGVPTKKTGGSTGKSSRSGGGGSGGRSGGGGGSGAAGLWSIKGVAMQASSGDGTSGESTPKVPPARSTSPSELSAKKPKGNLSAIAKRITQAALRTLMDDYNRTKIYMVSIGMTYGIEVWAAQADSCPRLTHAGAL